MEIPILIGVDGEARDIIEKFNAGLYYEPENEKDFISKVIRLIDSKDDLKEFKGGGADLAFAYERKKLAKKMLTILKNTR